MRFCLALFAVLISVPALSQEPKAPAKKKAAPTPAFEQTKDVAGLPRVLIIGDSISIGYQVSLREALAGKANVHRPATNCGPTTRGVEQIEQWLATDNSDGKWDVIHFNFGLHDVYHYDDAGQRTDADKGHCQVIAADYEKNLETIVSRMKKTGAKLIFGLTTPVPDGSPGRVKGEEVTYNDIGRRVMQRHGVAIDDLYSFALPRLADLQLPQNVHFKPEGSKTLGEQVAKSIRQALGEK
jgi:acyl-CoA thioesterase-1